MIEKFIKFPHCVGLQITANVAAQHTNGLLDCQACRFCPHQEALGQVGRAGLGLGLGRGGRAGRAINPKGFCQEWQWRQWRQGR